MSERIYGVSVYDGVVVLWDEDRDRRVLAFIRKLREPIRRRLIAVQEHEGSLTLFWRGPVPKRYVEDAPEVYVLGDYWTICRSESAEAELEGCERP
jgi:hypothetical protein